MQISFKLLKIMKYRKRAAFISQIKIEQDLSTKGALASNGSCILNLFVFLTFNHLGGFHHSIFSYSLFYYQIFKYFKSVNSTFVKFGVRYFPFLYLKSR